MPSQSSKGSASIGELESAALTKARTTYATNSQSEEGNSDDSGKNHSSKQSESTEQPQRSKGAISIRDLESNALRKTKTSYRATGSSENESINESHDYPTPNQKLSTTSRKPGAAFVPGPSFNPRTTNRGSFAESRRPLMSEDPKPSISEETVTNTRMDNISEVTVIAVPVESVEEGIRPQSGGVVSDDTRKQKSFLCHMECLGMNIYVTTWRFIEVIVVLIIVGALVGVLVSTMSESDNTSQGEEDSSKEENKVPNEVSDPFKENEYIASSQLLTWNNHREIASGQNGDLASIHNNEENEFIADLTNGEDKYFVGGYRNETNLTQWLWSDETDWDVTLSKWGPGQPDRQYQTKLVLGHNGKADEWDDEDGDSMFKAIYRIPS